MKRLVLVATSFFVALSVVLGQPVSAASDVNNFHISTYDIQYELSRDSEGHSVLKTVETITAEFPEYDQNRGLERAIPTKFDGRSLPLTNMAITDEVGESRNYSVRSENGNDIYRIGDADKYVHGSQTYRIEYTQRDVTRFYENTGRDEWYWDTNGTDWKVPIDRLQVSVTLDSSIEGLLEGAPSCYIGTAGSTDQCELLQAESGEYRVQTGVLNAYENVTVAFGFPENTFVAYELTPIEHVGRFIERLIPIWLAVQAVTWTLAWPLVIILVIQHARRKFRIKKGQPIPTEYIPPAGISVTVAGQLVPPRGSLMTAQLLDLAVRRIIAIVETKPKGVFRSAEYDIVTTGSVDQLRPEEYEVLYDIFGVKPAVGDRRSLKSLRTNTAYAQRLVDNQKKIQKLLEESYLLRAKSPEDTRYFRRWAITLAVTALLTLSIPLGIVALIAYLQGRFIRPLTDEGVRLRLYVLGLEKYVSSTESERIAFLQGPDTAEKVGFAVDVNDASQMVKLYERNLPYATLFGKEREWVKRLGDLYGAAQVAPEWYQGVSVFQAATFAEAMRSFSASASTYASHSSSSSGGSSGGGSSGGGGGGGGGGGW